MRTFVVVSHTAPLEGDFSLSDLPGGAGRIDILCRCATEAFLLSHGIRKDVRLIFAIRDQLIITLEGAWLRHLNPDERSTAALLRKAISRGAGLGPGEVARSTSGITVRAGGLNDVIAELGEAGRQPYLLEEEGLLLRRAELTPGAAFVLSDHRDFEPEERALLDTCPRLSVGPRSLHGHQCITLVHSELDLREAGWTDG